MKSTHIFSVSLLLLFSINFCLALTVTSESESNVIIPELNHPARFTLTITGATEGNYNIYTLTDVNIKPTSPFHLTAGTNSVEIFVYPSDQLSERGFYTFTYNIGDSQQKLTTKIVNLEDAIEISSDSINPDSDRVTFYVENKEKFSIENLKVKFTSILFKTDETISLKPYEKTEITVSVNQNQLKKTRAGAYVVKGEFKTNDGTKIVEGKIYLGEKKGITTQDDTAGLIIRTRTITKINSGNVDENIKITLDKNIISRLFSSFSEEPTIVNREGFKITYTWNKQLSPAESFTVKANTNYLFPLLIIIFAGLIILGFKRFVQTKVEVTKSVSPIKTKGGEFALRVKLAVKARKFVENVSLVDKIPSIVKIYNKFGTSKPDKIDTANRRIQWNIGNLNAGEERVFSYVVYSKIGVLGKFSLPEALSVFEVGGEIHEVESNKVFFLSEQTSKDD